MAKRPCFSDDSPTVSKRYCDRSNIDALLDSLIAVSDSALIDASFDDLVDSRFTDSDQNNFIQRALNLGSVLLEAGERSVHKRSSVHNAIVWPLSPDLTIKVFSMLDTPSVCSAASTCSFFQKCSIDPFMIVGYNHPNLNRCHLRRLHLYKIESMDNKSLLALLSVCSSLVDLEIVYLNVDISPTLESVSKHCHLIERFVYESEGGKDDIVKTSAVKEFTANCSKITNLALKRSAIYDTIAYQLVKGFHRLKYVDFTQSVGFDGSFLMNLGANGNNLEVIILRECLDLDKVEVKKFMKVLLSGKFRLLRHLFHSQKATVETKT